MGRLEDNIRLIRNERNEGGNTKERVAETLDLLVAELRKKVDNEDGKGLSTNDFTNENKSKLEGLQQVDASRLLPKGGYTGTAQDLKNLIDAINRILQSDDTDLDQLQEIVTYIKQNKHILSTLGISNIAGLVDALAAKAEKDHTHNWDDIQGKPNNLATTENVKTAVEGIQVGGRNYFLNSKFFKTTSFYAASGITVINKDNEGLSEIHSTSGNGNWVRIYDNPTNIDYFVDKYVTVSFDIKVLEGDLKSPNFYGGSFMDYQEVKPISGLLEISKWNRVYTTFLVKNSNLTLHLGFANSIGKYQFKNFKFEIGNKPTDWSPAPEDIKEYDPVGNIINGTRQILPNEADKVIFITNSVDNCALNVFPNRCSVSFLKTFDGGHVNFTCLGKNIIYAGGINEFNGSKGSTAVVSIHENDCYVRISNV
nr:hypothetical protein [uncultured Capnocytophaga sp.]